MRGDTMIDSWTTTMADDLSMVWDNDEASHLYIGELLARSETPHELAYELKEFYEDSIDLVLRETPSSSVGHMLVLQVMMCMPLSVFDMLANDYWNQHQRELRAS